MAIFRVNKNKNYTVMSNNHLKEKNMSLKAKGLLSQMFSLPDEWDYSIAGLVAINKEEETSIKNTLKELQSFGYLKVTKLMPNETESGRIEYVYDIYELSQKQEVEKQGVDFLGVEFLEVENKGQSNTKESNTKKLNTKYIYMGNYKRIKLTEEQYQKLKNEFGENYINNIIDLLDEYVESNNNKNKYSNYNLVIRKAIRENWFKINKQNEYRENTPTWYCKNIEEDRATDEEINKLEERLKKYK